MTTLANRNSRRRIRKLFPSLVVAVVAVLIALSAVSNYSASKEAFAFNVYWPSPTNYYPGAAPPNLYLRINYTGPGFGNFTYIITYNSSSGVETADSGNVLVSHLSPFTAYLSIPVSTGTVTIAKAQVFRGPALQQNLVYSKSVEL